MKNTNKTLFLHGGPGLHAAVERAWFGNSLPVLWWDQPAIATDDPTPFHTLAGHAARQLQTLADSSGQQVDLVAHSYGCLIAAALASKHPALIRRITLLGCLSLNPFHPFLYLGHKLLEAGYERPGLQDAMRAAQESPDESRFTALIQACFPDPAIPDIYFGPGSVAAKDRYLALASAAPPIDVPTFFAVMFDRLRAPPQPRAEACPEHRRRRFDGEVTAILGKHDPLHVEESSEKWREIFPQAQFKVMDAGHFLHLELPPEVWFGHP